MFCLGSPVDDQLKAAALSSIFGNEAEEILKKQLAIEQEVCMFPKNEYIIVLLRYSVFYYYHYLEGSNLMHLKLP